jgi:hypothetical protein
VNSVDGGLLLEEARAIEPAHSPAGAYSANPALTGKATFGFVSKYQKGAATPSGQTEFQFHVASFNFQSTAYAKAQLLPASELVAVIAENRELCRIFTAEVKSARAATNS